MNIQLHGKTAIVTGSTAGIGFAIAKGLAEGGASVIVNGRTEQRVSQAISKVQAEVPKAQLRGVPADLGTAERASMIQASATSGAAVRVDGGVVRSIV